MKVKLGDVCKKGTSNIAQKDLDGKVGNYPIYGAAGFILNVDFYQQEQPYIAVVKDGAGIGRVMKLPAKTSVISTMQYIIPNEKVDISYLAYAIEHMNLSKYFSGATIPHIYFKDYKKEELSLPPLDEQHHIAAVLDKVSDLIALRKKQLAKLEELVKARFVEMFGDPVNNERDWPVQHIKNVSPIVPYKGELKDAVWLLNLDMIEAKTGRILDYVFIKKEDVGSSTYAFDDNNVLYSKLRPYLNKVVLPDRKGYATSELLPLRPEKCLNKIFLAGLLRSNSFVKFISEKVSGAKMPRVVTKDFNKFNCIIPPLDLQQQFADFVKDVETQKVTIKQSLEKMEILKKSLMQEYFG